MKTSLLISLLLSTAGSFAQSNTRVLPSMVHGIGVSFQKFDGLNDRIADFPQYKELREHMGTLHLGWLKERDRLISGLYLNLGSSMSGDRDKRSSTLRFFGFSADVGYDLLSSDKLTLYPLVGLGFEKYQARFFKDNSATDFNDVLESPSIQNSLDPVDFKNPFFTYRLGAGFVVKAPKTSHSIGLQGGYIGSFKNQEWRSDENQELGNAPGDRLSRIFISLSFMSQPKFMKHK